MVKQVKSALAVGIYLAVLLWAYSAIIVPEFGYEGYRFSPPGMAEMGWLIALSLPPVLLLPYTYTRPSALILWWLYLTAYLPAIWVPALSLSINFRDLLLFDIVILLCMLILCLVPKGKTLAVNVPSLNPTAFWPALITIWLVFLVLIAMHGSSNLMDNLLSLLNGASIYDLREEYKASFGRVMSYMVGCLGMAINPYLIAIGTTSRRRQWLLSGTVGQVAIFALTGFKAVLSSIFLIPLLFFILRRWRASFGVALPLVFTTAILFCAAVDHFTNNVTFSSLFTRRMLLTPGLLTGLYFEHYSHVAHTGIGFHLSLGSGYVFGPASEIGLTYFGSENVHANANLWAEGFAELGTLGMIAFTLLVTASLWLYDSIASRREVVLAGLMAIMPAIALSNTTPTTVLITHGGIATALLLCLSPQMSSVDDAAFTTEEHALAV